MKIYGLKDSFISCIGILWTPWGLILQTICSTWFLLKKHFFFRFELRSSTYVSQLNVHITAYLQMALTSLILPRKKSESYHVKPWIERETMPKFMRFQWIIYLLFGWLASFKCYICFHYPVQYTFTFVVSAKIHFLLNIPKN